MWLSNNAIKTFKNMTLFNEHLWISESHSEIFICNGCCLTVKRAPPRDRHTHLSFFVLFERSCSRNYLKWLIIFYIMVLKKGTIEFLSALYLFLRHFHPLTGQLCMAWSVVALLYFVARSVLLRCSWQEPLPLACPVCRHWEALQLLFNITTCWCQWLTGLTIDPSHHIKVSISAAEFIVGPHPERAELSTALGDARKSDKCWNHFKGANSALSPF